MRLESIAVFLPCHSLDDFSPWLEEREADGLLAAWTAAWHPALIAAVGSPPGWRSVETPPADPSGLLGIVPAACDERFAGLVDMAGFAGSRFVRRLDRCPQIVAAARAALVESGVTVATDAPLAEDFHALGLARLLAELLARRMRSSTDIVTDDFNAAAVAAARAAVGGDEPAARGHLRECFAALEATRSQYYPVDVWLLDLVLVAESTLGRRLAGELDAPTPLGLVVTGRLIEQLGRDEPELLARLRDRVAAGAVEVVGGRDDATPVDFQLLETLAGSFDRGRAICRDRLGTEPVTFGQCSGGSSAFLPRLLADRGYRGAIWNLFDGTPLPDPHSSRIRWQGNDGACIDAVARDPFDARAAGTVLRLAERIGDAMDHDHTCIVPFAHYAGTASPWFSMLRRIAGWSTLFGRFVTPATLFAETAHAGTLVEYPPDAFPPTLPGAEEGGDPIAGRIAATRAEAATLSTPVPALGASAPSPAVVAAPRAGASSGVWSRLVRGLVGSSGEEESRFVLEGPAVRLAVHPLTGGVLSLRAPGARGNRLSQAVAVRSTRSAPSVGAAWESAEERAEYSRMVAERIDREGDAVIVSRGALVATSGARLGGFVQRFTLVEGLPLVRLDIDVELDRPLAGPFHEAHVACRFAWNENDDADLCRSLHGRAIVTERTRFTAPHFLEVRSAAERGEAGRVLIVTAGLAWHVRTTPHTVDTILVGPGILRASRRIAIGLGIESPLPVALAVLREPSAGAPFSAGEATR